MSNLLLNTQNSTPYHPVLSVAPAIQTMSSKDLLEVINQVRESFGESKIRLNDFNNRIADELENDNYESFVVQNFNNTESIHYRLTEEQCMLVSMRESKLVRRTVLNQLKMMKPRTPQTYKEALQFLIEAEEQKEQLALQVAQQQQVIEVIQPKADVYDIISNSDNTYTIRVAAKLLKVRPKDLTDWLITNKWMYGRSAATYRPSSQHDRNHLKLVASQYGTQVRVTGKGLVWIARKLNIELTTAEED
ncbi:MAG: phage antirepressor KilAC domain-containing protein [Acinetobacter johnsonii]|nr:phage antirepressor KilAC domain-containing protein [Acinetobacter johnsonii]